MNHSNLFNKNEATESELVLKKGQFHSKPDFSIFIPTFNRPYLLKQSLESALNQNYNGIYEIVIIDNCSIFENFEIVKDYIIGLHLKTNESISLYKCFSHSNSWNMGILKSASDWVIMLHDDDLLNYNHLSEVERIISLNPNIKALCSDSFNLVETNQLSFLNKLFIYFKEIIKIITRNRLIKLTVYDFYFHNPASNTGVVLNRASAIASGGFNTLDKPFPDYVFFYNLTREFDNTYYLNKKLSTIRFSVNDGLKPEVILDVQKKSEKLREDIRTQSKFYDYGYYKCMSDLNDIASFDKLSFINKYFKKPILTIYTRIISLFIFAKSLIFNFRLQ
jgi:glycosyltransferase involved in cell wall biosynthesis